jgi:hypothetical protein
MGSIGLVMWYRYLQYCLGRVVMDCAKPSTDGVVADLLRDVARNTLEIMAENAFLRQQLLVLRPGLTHQR